MSKLYRVQRSCSAALSRVLESQAKLHPEIVENYEFFLPLLDVRTHQRLQIRVS